MMSSLSKYCRAKKKKKFELRLKEEKLLDLQEESTEKAEITSKCINARNC